MSTVLQAIQLARKNYRSAVARATALAAVLSKLEACPLLLPLPAVERALAVYVEDLELEEPLGRCVEEERDCFVEIFKAPQVAHEGGTCYVLHPFLGTPESLRDLISHRYFTQLDVAGMKQLQSLDAPAPDFHLDPRTAQMNTLLEGYGFTADELMLIVEGLLSKTVSTVNVIREMGVRFNYLRYDIEHGYFLRGSQVPCWYPPELPELVAEAMRLCQFEGLPAIPTHFTSGNTWAIKAAQLPADGLKA